MPPNRELYALTSEQVRILGELAAAYQNGELRFGNTPRKQALLDYPLLEFGTATATISGVSSVGAAPTTGSVNVFTFTSTGGTTDTGRNVGVYNFSTVSISTKDWVHFRRHRTGRYIVTRVDNEHWKPVISFTLTTALTTSTSSITLVSASQYGRGGVNPTTAFVINNTFNLFSGSSGIGGLAVHNSSNTYYMIQMECT